MTWYQDLTPCTYWDHGTEKFSAWLTAIGWLEQEYVYSTGFVQTEMVSRLCEYLVRPWSPRAMLTRGSHTCTLCGPRAVPFLRLKYSNHWVELGCSNLILPSRGFLYVTPSLIVHYILDHHYAPPEEFTATLMQCPPMHSEAYFEAVRLNGPPIWAPQVAKDANRERFLREAVVQDLEPIRILVVCNIQEVSGWFEGLAGAYPETYALDIVTTQMSDGIGIPSVSWDLVFIDTHVAMEHNAVVIDRVRAGSGGDAVYLVDFGRSSPSMDLKPTSFGVYPRCLSWPMSEEEVAELAQSARLRRALKRWLGITR